MKRVVLSQLEQLKRKYSLDQLRQAKYCRDEIRGLVLQDRNLGYSDDEIENRMGDYLDEVYESYQQYSEHELGLPEKDFDYIYTVLEDIDEPIKL